MAYSLTIVVLMSIVLGSLAEVQTANKRIEVSVGCSKEEWSENFMRKCTLEIDVKAMGHAAFEFNNGTFLMDKNFPDFVLKDSCFSMVRFTEASSTHDSYNSQTQTITHIQTSISKTGDIPTLVYCSEIALKKDTGILHKNGNVCRFSNSIAPQDCEGQGAKQTLNLKLAISKDTSDGSFSAVNLETSLSGTSSISQGCSDMTSLLNFTVDTDVCNEILAA